MVLISYLAFSVFDCSSSFADTSNVSSSFLLLCCIEPLLFFLTRFLLCVARVWVMRCLSVCLSRLDRFGSCRGRVWQCNISVRLAWAAIPAAVAVAVAVASVGTLRWNDLDSEPWAIPLGKYYGLYNKLQWKLCKNCVKRLQNLDKDFP
jgi:hypothetical protein